MIEWVHAQCNEANPSSNKRAQSSKSLNYTVPFIDLVNSPFQKEKRKVKAEERLKKEKKKESRLFKMWENDFDWLVSYAQVARNNCLSSLLKRLYPSTEARSFALYAVVRSCLFFIGVRWSMIDLRKRGMAMPSKENDHPSPPSWFPLLASHSDSNNFSCFWKQTVEYMVG